MWHVISHEVETDSLAEFLQFRAWGVLPLHVSSAALPFTLASPLVPYPSLSPIIVDDD